MKRYGVVIDTDRCIGCQTCIIGCSVDHELLEGVYWGKLETVGSRNVYQPTGKFPNVRMRSRTLMCNHCAKPACVPNCPTGAMQKREDGIVFVDYDSCIGCGVCAYECPYGIPSVVNEDGVNIKSNKCNLCYDRVDRGQVPFCVQSCPAQARIFGDLNDKNSEAARLIAAGQGYQLKPEAKTDPSLYYVGK